MPSAGIDAHAQGYVEREAFGAAVLVEAVRRGDLSPAPVWCGDVRDLDVAPLVGQVDLVLGGFPCQDISHAGSRAGIMGDRSALWFQVARVFREVGARYLFVENVRALTVRGLDVVLGTLADLGCAAEWTCLRASDIGAPHQRDRFFLLAVRERDGLEGFEQAGTAAQAARRGGRPVEYSQSRDRGPGECGAEEGAGARAGRRRRPAGAGGNVADPDLGRRGELGETIA